MKNATKRQLRQMLYLRNNSFENDTEKVFQPIKLV